MSEFFEWDEAKRLVCLDKHGIDFCDAVEVFETDYLELPARSEAEERLIAVGLLQDVTVAVVFTCRGGAIRIITARRARKNEREQYDAHVALRNSEAQG